jgi:phenylacetaldehyde dehydrogenase
MLIGGNWVPAASGKILEVFNPASGSVLARVAAGGRQEVDPAVRAARAAFDTNLWGGLGADARGKILWRIADLIEAHLDELSELESLNNGMPFRDAKFFHIAQSARCFRYFAGWPGKILG